MIRALRRALRQWKTEVLGFWGRFSAFYRIVFGIVLAMGIVYGARRQALDAVTQRVDELAAELEELDAPSPVPTPEADDDLQIAMMQVENLEHELKKEREETKALLQNRSNARGRSAARETMDRVAELIAQNALAVRSSVPVECEGEFPLPRVCRSYDMTGEFPAVHGFLRQLAELDAPCRLRRLSLRRFEPEGGDSHPIRLTFIFESMYTEE